MAAIDNEQRRTFLKVMGSTILIGATVKLTGCGTAMQNHGQSNATLASKDVIGTVANNHGHEAIITGIQLGSSKSVRISIQATANHDHVIELSVENLKSILGGAEVSVESDGGETVFHSHVVTFNPQRF